ncbi:hypothetical protein QA861_27840 [Streptomyces sp. B21-083]
MLETRILLGTWALAVAGGVAAGIAGADSLAGVVDRQRAEASSVSAVLVRAAPAPAHDVETGSVYDHVIADVRWTDTDGTVRTDWTRVDPGTRAGTAIMVWTDGEGHLVPAPIGPAQKTALLALTGSGTAAAGGAAVLLAGWGVRKRVEQGATDCWGTEWDQVGPGWGHKTG